MKSAKAAVVSVNMDRQHGRWRGIANNRRLREVSGSFDAIRAVLGAPM